MAFFVKQARSVRKYRSHERSTLFPDTLDKFHLPGNFVSWLVATASRQKPSNRFLLPATKRSNATDDLSSRWNSTDSVLDFQPLHSRRFRYRLDASRSLRCTIAIGKQWACIRGLPPGQEWNCTCRTIYNGQTMRFRIEHSRGKLTKSFRHLHRA